MRDHIHHTLMHAAGSALFVVLSFIMWSYAYAEDRNKTDVILWYEAFNKNDPKLLDRILSQNWVDIPAPPGQPA